jgi:hypothetical protein
MNTRFWGPMIAGAAALILMVAAAFVPWFEWSLQEYGEAQVESSGIWGPPSFVPGTPFGSVEVSANHQRVVDVSAGVYVVLIAATVVTWSVLLLPSLSCRLGSRRAALVVVGGGAVLCVGVGIISGFAVFFLTGLMRDSMVRSTRIVVAELQRMRVVGPLLLLVGLAGEIVALVWARRALQLYR